MARRPRLRVLVPILVVSLVGVFALAGVVTRNARNDGGGGERALDRAAMSSGSVVAEPAPAVQDEAGAGVLAEGDVALAVPPASAYSAHRLVRTGDLSLLVPHGKLLSTVDRIASLTMASGGYVMSSAVGSDGGAPIPLAEPAGELAPQGDLTVTEAAPASRGYATMTLRVPERSFDATLRRLSELGRVQSVSTSSEDVTSQYVDLRARLRHYRAVERRLVRFLAETDTVSEMLAVQDRIDKVQLTIEQLSAQLKSLREITTYGTLSVFVQEKAGQGVASSSDDTFTGTLWRSLVLLGRGARVTGLVITALLPFAVAFGGIGLVTWFAVRRVRRGRQHPAQPSLPA